MATILLKFKDSVIREINLGHGVLTVGRDPGNDIEIDNPAISGTHATIWQEGENVYVEDADSTNGTYFKGERVVMATLGKGDEVIIGKHTLQFVTGEGGDDAPVKPFEPSLDKTMMLDTKVKKKVLGRSKGERGGFDVIDGSADKERYELVDRVSTIGKSSSALIKLKGFFAPKVAALVNRTDKGYIITPANEKHLPRINGLAINKEHPLKDKDVIEIGGLRLEFFID